MKVCRTCLHELSNDAQYLSLDTLRNKLLLCVPELALDTVQYSVVCLPCSDALTIAYDFKNKCLQTEQKLLTYTEFSNCSTNAINLSDLLMQTDHFINIKSEVNVGEDFEDVNGTFTNSSISNLYQPLVQIEEGVDLSNKLSFCSELDVEVSYQTNPLILYPRQDNSLCEKSTTLTSQFNNCPYCSVTFSNAAELHNHISNHTSHKRLICSICARGFAHKNKLVLHMRIHTGEKPFQCNICGRSFSRKDKLKDHKRTHTGEKPHQCILCQKSYARKDKLNLHMRTNHWRALANLEITIVKSTAEATATNSKVSAQ